MDATAFVPDSSAHSRSFRLLYASGTAIALYFNHRLDDVDLVCSNDVQSLAGFYIVDTLHAAAEFPPINIWWQMAASLSHQPASRLWNQSPWSESRLARCYGCLLRLFCPALQLLVRFLVTLVQTPSLTEAQIPLLRWTQTSSYYHNTQ